MLSHEEMVGLQAEKHDLTDADNFQTAEQLVLHLMHVAAYIHASQLLEGKAVLDLGCNTGYGTAILASAANRAIGVDVSERAIDSARLRNSDSKVDFRLINGRELPFDDNAFDAVTCFQVIEHLVDYDVFLNELKRVLRPDGLAIFTTPNALLRLDPGMKPWNPFHVREFDAEELQTTLDRYFDHVGLLALHAREPVHELVTRRADRIRRAARNRNLAGPASRLRRSARAHVKALLPRWAMATVSRYRTPRKPTPSLDFVAENYSVDDFRYSTDGFATCLEFMAVCSERALTADIKALTTQRP